MLAALELFYQLSASPDVCPKLDGLKRLVPILVHLLSFSPDHWPDRRKQALDYGW